MNLCAIRKIILIFAMAMASVASGCGSRIEGKYTDPSGMVVLQLNDGKAYMAFGALTVHGTYTVSGDKITVTGDNQTVVFTKNKDGSIDGPGDSFIPRLYPAK